MPDLPFTQKVRGAGSSATFRNLCTSGMQPPPRAGAPALEGLTLYLRFEQQVLLGHLPYGVKVRAKVPGVPHSGLGSPMRKCRETRLMAATAGGRHGLLAQCTTLVSSPGSATYQLVSRGSHVTAPSLTVLLWELGMTVITSTPACCSRTHKWVHVKLVKWE